MTDDDITLKIIEYIRKEMYPIHQITLQQRKHTVLTNIHFTKKKPQIKRKNLSNYISRIKIVIENVKTLMIEEIKNADYNVNIIVSFDQYGNHINSIISRTFIFDEKTCMDDIIKMVEQYIDLIPVIGLEIDIVTSKIRTIILKSTKTDDGYFISKSEITSIVKTCSAFAVDAHSQKLLFIVKDNALVIDNKSYQIKGI